MALSLVHSQDALMNTDYEPRCLFFVPNGDLRIMGRQNFALAHSFMFTRELVNPIALSAARAASASGNQIVLESPWWAPDCAILFVLSLLYPQYAATQMPSSGRDWALTHMLASYWGLASVKTKAEQMLDQMLVQPVGRVVAGRLLGVEAWVQMGLQLVLETSIRVGLTAEDIEQMLARRQAQDMRAMICG